jgi:hypothetical protein
MPEVASIIYTNNSITDVKYEQYVIKNELSTKRSFFRSELNKILQRK